MLSRSLFRTTKASTTNSLITTLSSTCITNTNTNTKYKITTIIKRDKSSSRSVVAPPSSPVLSPPSRHIPSNATTRVPPPVYDNTVIKRRAFKGKTLHLTALDAKHAPDLWGASGKGNQEMGEYLPGTFPSTPLQFNYYIRDLQNINDDPFSRGVVFCILNMLEQDLPVGVVSMNNISSGNKTLDIGFTWIDREFWGTHVGLETYYILMEETFEFLKFNRIGFTCSYDDARYQGFLEGIGAKQEGLLRNFHVGADGKTRDVIQYSVIESEWPTVKAKIRSKIVDKLRIQTERAKERLAEDGLLEDYNKSKEREGKVLNKKVVKIKTDVKEEEEREREREMEEDDEDEKRLFANEDEVNEEIEKKRGKRETKTSGQKKRPMVSKSKLKKSK